MSKEEKLFSKILNLNNKLMFKDIKKVLEKCGYVGTYPNGGSSHCTFRKEGCNPITIPTHNPVGVVYVKLVRDIIKGGKK